MFEFNSAMICFFIRLLHYRKSSINPSLSNKPPPPPATHAFSGEES